VIGTTGVPASSLGVALLVGAPASAFVAPALLPEEPWFQTTGLEPRSSVDPSHAAAKAPARTRSGARRCVGSEGTSMGSG
jgi:hypothetical protein